MLSFRIRQFGIDSAIPLTRAVKQKSKKTRGFEINSFSGRLLFYPKVNSVALLMGPRFERGRFCRWLSKLKMRVYLAASKCLRCGCNCHLRWERNAVRGTPARRCGVSSTLLFPPALRFLGIGTFFPPFDLDDSALESTNGCTRYRFNGMHC